MENDALMHREGLAGLKSWILPWLSKLLATLYSKAFYFFSADCIFLLTNDTGLHMIHILDMLIWRGRRRLRCQKFNQAITRCRYNTKGGWWYHCEMCSVHQRTKSNFITLVQWILTKACFAVWTMFYDWFWYYGVSPAEISRVPLWHSWAEFFRDKNKMAARYFKVKYDFSTNKARNKCNTSF